MDKLSNEGFIETVAYALENLRQDHPEIEWEVDEDSKIVVWIARSSSGMTFQ